MLQEILTYVIVFVTLLIVCYKIYQTFTKPKSGCDGCSSNCSGCALDDLKKEIEKNKK